MVQCPKCSAENPPESRFCNSCGEELSSLSQAPTVAAPEGEAALSPVQSPHVGRIVSSDTVPAGGFTPGTILADRYRIIGLLGRGGMGEVYRADDLKLGQPVALKFLPPALAEDSVRRERFFAEVRITRQLSHPNICRVYDIGEFEGRHFLSMEFIDGEDLASLMKRIGSLTNEKALDIARQLVAGLSVAHERGVLHRDLKPANIMLDGHGRVRITDFGLAIAVGDETQAEEIAGTPAYMAPEQLAGKGATVRSDIYSLGLILYEIYTGKKAFKAKTLAELREQKETQTPRAPSELRDGIDSVVERVIQRCMEKDPNARPASVAQLAQALPGGDPLAAAIAAGETPSPEMVAASGSKEGIRPIIAWSLLAFILVGTIAILAMNDLYMLHRRIPFKNHPEHLVKRAQQIINRAGYSDEPVDSAYGFTLNGDLLSHIADEDKAADRWDKLDERAIFFWYRQSPHPIQGLALRSPFVVTYNNPPSQYSGEIAVVLDTEGHLVALRAVPDQVRSSTEITVDLNWEFFFEEAGIEDYPNQWNPVEDKWIPPSYADSTFAWQYSLPNQPDTPVRIEAASFQGKPVRFEIIEPWTTATWGGPYQNRTDTIIRISAGMGLLIMLIGGGAYFARRNLRLGRGDRRNANRLALFTIIILMISHTLRAHHVLTFREYSLFVYNVSLALFYAGLLWILYIAFEPYVRRQWPKVLISWTRLLSGEWRDPHIARDMLIGCVFGILINLILNFSLNIIPPLVGYSSPVLPGVFNLISIEGPRLFSSVLLILLFQSVYFVLGLFCLLFFLKTVLKNQKAAIAVFILFTPLLKGPGNFWDYGTWAAICFLGCFILIRFGIVVGLVSLFVMYLFKSIPIGLDTSAWYSETGYTALAIFAAIVLYSFYHSLGGRPIFGTPRLDD